MLFFQIQRENDMCEKDERVWLPAADWLLATTTTLCLLLVIVPNQDTAAAAWTLTAVQSASAGARLTSSADTSH